MYIFVKPKIIFLRLLGAKVGSGVRVLTKLKNLDLKYVNYLTIGNNVTIAKNSMIFTHNGAINLLTKFGISKEKCLPVVINDDVFIGAGSIILPGVTIGKGSIVGAGSVVTKSVPDNCIVAGNPAEILKQF
jgi:maltose O-acetyltransferase